MRTIELVVWPARAQFRPGEQVTLQARLAGGPPGGRLLLRVRLLRLGQPVVERTSQLDLDPGGRADQALRLDVPPDRAGYAVEAWLDRPAVRATTACDVAGHWSAAPRYGFFADFPPDEPPAESRRRADELLRLHLNVVQCYDWAPNHHTYFPPGGPEFADPLGRRISHTVVGRKIQLAHERGIAALGYGALYGAEADFSTTRPDWLLYDGAGQPLRLADLFYLQDISATSPWRPWIIEQYRLAVRRLGFDGIHIDQYGFPKRARSRAAGDWQELDLADCLPGFVEEAAAAVLAERPGERAGQVGAGSIFNCVNGWPVEAMPAVTSDAATYLEVWEPHTSYRDLYQLVRYARTLRPDKQVILAAYLSAFHPDRERTPGALTGFRLASAAIHASGGFHLIAGEGGDLLADPYYPRYGRLGPAERAVVRRYLDFVVRSTELLHPADPAPDIAWSQVGPTNDVIVLEHPELDRYGAGAHLGSIWVTGHEQDRLTSLQLMNLRGIASEEWSVDQPEPPQVLAGVELRARVTSEVTGVWWDTPDDEVGIPRVVPFDVRAGLLRFRVPRIEYWTAVWWRTTEAAA